MPRFLPPSLLLLAALLAALPATASAETVLATEQARVHADAFGKRIAWSSFDPVERVWHLNTRQRGRVVRTAAPPAPHPFRLDVGPGPDGRPVAVYPRCRRERCDLFLYDFAEDRQRKLRGVSTQAASESLPSVWRKRIAFARREGGVSTMYVARLNGRRARVLPRGLMTGPSGPIALELRRSRVAFVWSRQGSGGLTQNELFLVRDGDLRFLDRTTATARSTSTFLTPELRRRWVYYGRSVTGRGDRSELRRAHVRRERVEAARSPFKGLAAAVWMRGRFLLSRVLDPVATDPEGECRRPGSDPAASVCRLVIGDPVDRWSRAFPASG